MKFILLLAILILAGCGEPLKNCDQDTTTKDFFKIGVVKDVRPLDSDVILVEFEDGLLKPLRFWGVADLQFFKNKKQKISFNDQGRISKIELLE